MPADLDPSQFCDAAGDRLTVRVDDGVGRRRAGHEGSRGHEHQPRRDGDTPAQPYRAW